VVPVPALRWPALALLALVVFATGLSRRPRARRARRG
jgi:hypothetical protein